MDLIFLSCIGALAGLVAGLVGLAGGIVVVPALTWIYGPEALHSAIVISWFAVLFNSLGAAAKQWRIRSPQQRAELLHGARWFLVGATLMTPLIAGTASGYRGLLTVQLVAGLQLCLAAVMLWPINDELRQHKINPARDASFGGLIGAVSTLIGVGGGTYTIAYFVYGAGAHYRDAIATANLAGLAVGALSVTGYLATLLFFDAAAQPHSLGPITGWGMASVVVAGAAAAPFGVAASRHLPVRALRHILIGVLVISAGRLMLA